MARTRNAAIMWRRSRVTLTSSATAASTISVVDGVLPAPRVGERLDTLRELDEVPFLERAQQLVLVAEAGVEAAHRRAGAARDLGNRDRRVPLLLDQRFGGVEQPLQRALAARLLGTADRGELEGGRVRHFRKGIRFGFLSQQEGSVETFVPANQKESAH